MRQRKINISDYVVLQRGMNQRETGETWEQVREYGDGEIKKKDTGTQ
jgi:hypothetical protein